jgi:cytochrome P450
MPDGLRRVPIEIDPPEHTAYRRLLQPYFSQRRLAILEPRVRRFAGKLLQPLIEAGHADVAAGFTYPFPTRVLCATLNIPDEDWARLRLWAADASNRDPRRGNQRASQSTAGHDAFMAYARDMIAERRRNPLDPADDMTTGLLAARIDGEYLTDDAILGILRLMLSAGHNSTTISLGIVIAFLAQHQQAQAALRAEPALITNAIEEILRYHTPVVANASPRVVTRDVEVRGRALRAGDQVVLVWGSGNRDEEAFAEADRCVLDRSPNRHLVFGYGVHRCIGAPVARQGLRIAVEELLARTTSFALDGPIERGRWWRQRGPTVLPLRFATRPEGAAASAVDAATNGLV